MNKKTKIVCTMGPSTDSLEMVESLLRAGMNVARFNFSHGSHEEQAKRMELVRLASTRTGIPVALMLDRRRASLHIDHKRCGRNKRNLLRESCRITRRRERGQTNSLV